MKKLIVILILIVINCLIYQVFTFSKGFSDFSVSTYDELRQENFKEITYINYYIKPFADGADKIYILSVETDRKNYIIECDSSTVNSLKALAQSNHSEKFSNISIIPFYIFLGLGFIVLFAGSKKTQNQK